LSPLDTARTPVALAYREATRAAWLGLAVNLLLGAAKLLGGLQANSFALVADSVNSLGDVVTSCVVLIALRYAQLPPDRNHPYGHTRAEAVAGSNVALLVLTSALLLGWETLARFGVSHRPPPLWALGIAGSNVVIKEALYQYKVRVGRRTGSIAVIANAWDHRSDALSALAVLAGLAVVSFAGPDLVWADEAAALVVVAMILWSAGALFWRSARELLDTQAPPPLVEAVRHTAGAVEGVRDVEKLWIRKSGLEYLVDIHVEVDPDRTVADGHRIGHLVQEELQARFPRLRSVLVHLEPHGHASPHRNPDS